jgi:hypothetical protein
MPRSPDVEVITSSRLPARQGQGASLVDVLDRVLDKGLVVAGDIKISLAEVELLTIRIRLVVCSLDKAEQVGLDWWKHDAHLAPRARIAPRAQPARRLRRARGGRHGR